MQQSGNFVKLIEADNPVRMQQGAGHQPLSEEQTMQGVMNGMMGSGMMMWGMGLFCLLILAVLVLAVSALIKYLFFNSKDK